MNRYNHLSITLVSACLLAFGAAGCQRTESPAKTESDMSKAAIEGEHDAAQTRHDVAQKTMDAQKEVNEAKLKLAHESAEGRRDIVNAEAETRHKVAIEACEPLTGDARSDCKKRADLEFEQAKLMADTHAQLEDPKR
jgi:hypothetical protein